MVDDLVDSMDASRVVHSVDAKADLWVVVMVVVMVVAKAVAKVVVRVALKVVETVAVKADMKDASQAVHWVAS